MADIAQFGVEIPAVKGAKEAQDAFRGIGRAASDTDKAVAGSTRAFSQYSLGVLSAMRSLSPFTGEVERMALGLERSVARFQRMATVTADMTTAQIAAEKAARAGLVTDASRAAVLEGVAKAERAVTQASVDKTAALRAATTAGNALASAIRAQSQVEQNFANLQMSGAARNALLTKTTNDVTSARRAYLAQSAAAGAAIQGEKLAVDDLNKARTLEQETLKLSTGGMTGLVAVAGTVIAVLAALAAAIYAVKKAWDFFSESVTQAAASQTITTTFKLLVNNAGLAAGALKQLQQVSQNTGGFFKTEELVRASNVLKVAGVDVRNLGTYTQGIAVLAEKAGVGVEQMAQAWSNAIKGRVTSSTLEGNTIMQQLGVTTGKTGQELRNALTNGSLGARTFTQALIDAAKQTDVLAARQADFASKVKIIKNEWETVHEAFGAPIIDALGPLLDEVAVQIRRLAPIATAAGTLVAVGLSDAITSIGRAVSGLHAAFVELDRIGVKFAGIGKTIQTIVNTMAMAHIPGAGLAAGAMQAGADIVQGAGKAEADAAKVKDGASGLMSTFQDLDDLMDKTHDKSKDFEGDLKTLIEYWKDYSDAQAFSTDETSRNWHTQEALQKAIKGLGDPMKDVERLIPGLSPDQAQLARWMAYDEAVDRAIKNSEMRMKAGMASMGEIVDTGLAKMTRSWGTWQEQVSNSIGDIGNALASGISTGLTDILMGTKSVKDGFREMALSIIKDIENIILKMLVQLAIQQLISAAGGGGSAAGAASLGTAFGGGLAAGGPVPGSGRGDKVPAMLEPGEFVIPRDQAQRFGYGNLERIRKMAGGGQVTTLPGNLTPMTYGPGSPDATSSDRRQFTGAFNDNRLGWGDIALSPNILNRYDLGLGDLVSINGAIYRVADKSYYSRGNPTRNAFEVYYPGGRGSRLGSDRNPFGRGGGFRSRLPGDPNARRLRFGQGDRNSRINFPGFNPRGGFDMPAGDRNRPGFMDLSGISPAGFDPYATGRTTGGYDPVTGRVTVGYIPGSQSPGDPMSTRSPIGNFGVPPTSTTSDMPTDWIGSTPFGTRSGGSPSSRSMYSGQPGGFNIPGGINLSGLGQGSHGEISWDYFGRMSLQRLLQGRDASLGFEGARNLSIRGAPILPVSRWGGAGAGGIHGTQISGGTTTGRRMSAFHEGGIIPMAAGGNVPIMAKGGEGVFTPEQMARMAPSGQTNHNNISISITNVNGKTEASTSGDLSEPQAREMARLVVAVVQSQMAKEKRVGGQNYVPRSQRGG